MAVMWPRALPSEVLTNTLRHTECQVYNRIKASLEDPFVVFYSRPWLGIGPDGQEIDGECDFVVAHPNLGLLTIEVKGGAVAYDPRAERWTSRDRWGLTHNIKNPVQQARISKYVLVKKLNASPHWKPRRIRARHAVVLPHSAAPIGDLGADMPRQLFCFLEDFEGDFRNWILDRLGEDPGAHRSEKELGQDGLRALENILARPFHLRTPLGCLLSNDDDVLHFLTQQQFHILNAIEEVKRVGICGGAGTGKTVLAVENALRCAETGMRTLFTCYNRALAADIRRRMARGSSVMVMNFHELCAEVPKRAKIQRPEGVCESHLFEELYPRLLIHAFERLPCERFDAIIVDEGQDFLPLWWKALDAGLNPNGQQILRIFYDNNQRVYDSAGSFPENMDIVPIRLTLNLRNTRRIHELVQRHYAGHAIEALGPEGVDVKWLEAEGPDAVHREISEYVHHLTSVEQVPARNITVLVSTERAIAGISRRDEIGGLRTSRCDAPTESSIILDSIRRFKGLESPVVIVAATPDIIGAKELPYVAMSRARTHLVLVGHREALAWISGHP